MSKINWVGAVLLGLIVWVGGDASWRYFSAYQQNQADERISVSSDNSSTGQHGGNSCGTIMDDSGFFDWLVCFGEEVTAPSEVKQGQYDLKAQQDMASWALGMLITTVWLTFITLLGVLFVWRTLIATRQTVSATKEVGRDQSRAYVHADSAELTWGGHMAQHPGVEITILNTGQTPAKWFSLVSKLEFVELDPLKHTLINKQMIVSEINFEKLDPTTWSALGAQKSLTVPGLRDDDYVAIKERYAISSKGRSLDDPALECGLQIFGYVEYETIFGEICRSEFCFGVRRPPNYEIRFVGQEQDDPISGLNRDIKQEIPIKMQRIPAKAKTYQKREK